MNLLVENEEKKSGLTIHTVETNKFKTNTLVLKVKAPLNESDVTKRALLPHVLQSATENFPTTTKLRSYLDELYGATLNVDLAKKGDYHIISFRLDIANEKFLKDQTPLLKKAIDLLAEVFQTPLLENGAFIQHVVQQEKRTLKQRIQAVFNDKMRYANLRLVQEMCKGEPYRLHVNGEMEDIEQITPSSLYEYYQKVLKEDQIDLYVIGDIQTEVVRRYIEEAFSIEDREEIKAGVNPIKTIEKENEIIEQQDVKQGKLNIGFRTNTTFSDDDYFALQLMNGIFGGFSHSKLFMNVREKESLAYYAASRVESHKGLLMVMSGIEAANYEKAVSIIKKQLEAMKSGDFSEEEINQTKAVIRNQLLESIDTSYGLVEVLYHNVVASTKRTMDEWLLGIENVTKEQIIQSAKKIDLDTIYFLKGQEENA